MLRERKTLITWEILVTKNYKLPFQYRWMLHLSLHCQFVEVEAVPQECVWAALTSRMIFLCLHCRVGRSGIPIPAPRSDGTGQEYVRVTGALPVPDKEAQGGCAGGGCRCQSPGGRMESLKGLWRQTDSYLNPSSIGDGLNDIRKVLPL